VYLSRTDHGSTVDITMARSEELRLPSGIELVVDLGFLGFRPERVTVLIPTKKPRNGELTQEQKDYNTLVASARVVNEHAIGGIKRCRSVKERLRNWKSGFEDTVIRLAACIHNLRVSARASYDTLL
jgi:DDE superfamily endonuclease